MVATTATFLAIGGLVLGGAGLYYQNQQQKKAAAAAKQQQEVASRASRRRLIRERQLKAAELNSVANAAGSADSSGFFGNQGSLGSQLGSGLGYQTQMSSLSGDIARYQTNAGIGGGLSNFGFTLYGASSSFGNSSPENFGRSRSASAPVPYSPSVKR